MTLSAEQKTSLDATVTTFQSALAVDVTAQTYLAGRGIGQELASIHRLGKVPEGVAGYEQYTGRLAIPYITPNGVVDIRFRSVDGSEPKYMSRSGSHTHLYNVGALQWDGDVVAICEGEFDAITATGLASIPTVGLPGANAWKPQWARAFQDYRLVLVFCDGDDPGREMGKKIHRDIDEATVIHLPDGEDVNSLVLSRGPDELRRRAGL